MNESGDCVEGIIMKGYSGFYYVLSHDQIYECSLRGKNRKKNVKFLPGDKVEFTQAGENQGAIETIYPRKNELLRPPIANVDQIIILAAMADPQPDFWLMDRLTLFAQWNGIVPLLCFSKADLLTKEQQEAILANYRPAGFPFYVCSTVTGEGIMEIHDALRGKISVLAGNSGVGKSSLINALCKNQWQLATGKVSEKLKRGRHTTRHVELFPLEEDTLLADTPGFSSLQLPEDLTREELGKLFPEFLSYLDDCRFSTCLHDSEPSCAVKEAVAAGNISAARYKNYLGFLKEVIAQERSY